MKKRAVLLVLAIAVAGGIFAPAAQAQAKQNAIMFLDVMPLFKGFLMSDEDADMFFFDLSFAYERMVAPHFSIGPELDLYLGKLGEKPNGDNIPYFYLGMAAAARYYPMSEGMEKFFIGASLGFNVQSIDGKTKTEYGGFAGGTIGLRAGYRLLFKNVFFVEPSMAYIYSKNNGGPNPLGWQGGLRLGIEL